MQTLAGEMWLPHPASPPKINSSQIEWNKTICDYCIWVGRCEKEVAKENFCGCENVLSERKLLNCIAPSPAEDVKLCECGCGGAAPIATRNQFTRGIVKGQPLRFINGYNNGHRKKWG